MPGGMNTNDFKNTSRREFIKYSSLLLFLNLKRLTKGNCYAGILQITLRISGPGFSGDIPVTFSQQGILKNL
jgi:hypothetical protein